MIVARTRAEVRGWSAGIRAQGREVCLVPTMGSLHAGHVSLIEIGRSSGAAVALSIFVNPLQFGAGEDFERYPRDLERDLGIAEQAGVELVFAPPVAEMYPAGEPWVVVHPEHGVDHLDAAHRPGHFRGVLTIVAKLFGIVSPDAAVFGQKDFQQLALIRRMVADLDMPVRIVPAPVVRESDGLAMSSRNRYLSAEDRRRALSLVEALRDCDRLFRSGVRDPGDLRQRLHNLDTSGVSVEYGEVVDSATLEPVTTLTDGVVCAIAAHVGGTRLIDNHILGNDRLD